MKLNNFVKCGEREQIKLLAYTAFVVMEKIKKRLKPKQRQQERNLLLLRAYLSFADSF